MIAQIAALVAILGTAVVYGTDVFCAIVLRPALARIDDMALAAVTGNIHRFGDRRMPVPGVIGLLGAAIAAVAAGIGGNVLDAMLAGAAFALLGVWLLLYLRISSPLNRILTAAADAHETPRDVRDLQRAWDRVIVPRAVLQGLAVLALGLSLIV
jgi:hypothetical protein